MAADFFENDQILMPDKSLVTDCADWQAMHEELLLFPQAGHDDLFDGLQMKVEGAMECGLFNRTVSIATFT